MLFRSVGASKSWGDHRVHDSLDFVLRRGDKTVLVGPNGAGKSTLFRMVTGEEQPES